jgi:hypothetical protein
MSFGEFSCIKCLLRDVRTLASLASVDEVSIICFSPRQTPEHQQANELDSFGDKRTYRAEKLVSFV